MGRSMSKKKSGFWSADRLSAHYTCKRIVPSVIGILCAFAILLSCTLAPVLGLGHVTGFTLIDASTNQEIFDLLSGDHIHLEETGSTLSIRANSEGDIGSIVFHMDGYDDIGQRINNWEPWALRGNSNGKYVPEPLLAIPGLHWITATPYLEANGLGGRGSTAVLLLEIVEHSPGNVRSPQNPTHLPTPLPTPVPIVAGAFQGRCMYDEILIDFDITPEGTVLKGGDYVKYEWLSAYGVTITASSADRGGFSPDGKARIYDTSIHGQDQGLGSPNRKCFSPGPGVGAGGEPGQPGENCVAQGNVLVIQDGRRNGPSGNSLGGSIEFHFDTLAPELYSIGLMDVEEPGMAHINILGADRSIQTINVNGLGSNSFQDVLVNMKDVKSLTVKLNGPGAVSHLKACVNSAHQPTRKHTPAWFPTIGPAQSMPWLLLAGQSNMVGYPNEASESSVESIVRIATRSINTEFIRRDLIRECLKAERHSSDYIVNEQIAEYEADLLLSYNPVIFHNIMDPIDQIYCTWDSPSRTSGTLQSASSVSLHSGCGSPWGPELMMSHTLKATYGLTDSVGIAKVAEGGTTLGQWNDQGGVYWKILFDRLEDMESIHENCRTGDCPIKAFVWFQGSQDTFEEGDAQNYESDLRIFIGKVRNEIFRVNPPGTHEKPADIPVVIVGIGCWRSRSGTGKLVLGAQEAFCDSDLNCEFVRTDNLMCYYHYDAASMLIIGHRVATAVKKLVVDWFLR